jgi:hypothetical protein
MVAGSPGTSTNCKAVPNCPPVDLEQEDAYSEDSESSDSDDIDGIYNTHTERATKDVPIGPAGHLLEIAFRGIDESLSELSRVGFAIRQSSNKPETVRARAFAARHPDSSEFELKASIAIQTLYPNAPESLQQQLVRGMLDRHARIRYRRSRHQQLQVDTRQISKPVHASQTTETLLRDKRMSAIKNLFQPSAAGSLFQKASGSKAPALSETVTSVNTQLLAHNLKYGAQRPSIQAKKTFSRLIRITAEPSLPKSVPGQAGFRCDWCFQVLDTGLIQNKKWTDRGR